MQRVHRALLGRKAGPGSELQHEKAAIQRSKGQTCLRTASVRGTVGEGGREGGADVRAGSLLEGACTPACR